MIKGIIIDLDGTLVKLPINYDKIQKKLQEFFHTTKNFTPLIPSTVESANGDKEKLEAAFNIICNEELSSIDAMKIIDGATNLLQTIQKTEISTILITMQCRDAVLNILSYAQIKKQIFSTIISRDESYDRFEQICKALKLLDLNPEEVIVIGDRLHDVKSAKKAGCKSILVNRIKSEIDDEVEVVENLVNLNLEEILS